MKPCHDTRSHGPEVTDRASILLYGASDRTEPGPETGAVEHPVDLEATPDWGARDRRWEGVESHWLDVDGLRVHTLRSDGSGTPQLLVHGLGGSATNWLEVVGELSADGPVVAVDLPGFGRTRPDEARQCRLGAQRVFLGRLLDALGWDRVTVHGNSMGGLLSVLLAASLPDRVESLVLCSPALPGPVSPAAIASSSALRLAPFLSAGLGTRVLGQMWRRLDPDEVFRQTELTVLADPDGLRDSLRQVAVENVALGQALDWRVPGFATAAADLLKHLARRTEIDGAVDAVRAPVLVVWGTEDRLVARAAMDRTTDGRPRWDRADLDGVGHAAMLESPDRYTTAARSWRALTDA